jgi:S-adenosyl-L-methionine hydrolase (adenosine-forming)
VNPRIVTLLSDFGTSDGYVAAMKGVIATLAPSAQITDAAHNIPAQDALAAAWTLSQYWKLFPEGTIHIAVVDPGVGTERKILCIEVDGRTILAPDNGLATLALAQADRCTCRALAPFVHRPGVLSNTFHAYAAGLIASGQKTIDELTVPAADFINPGWARPVVTATRIEGQVIHVDHFGNLITNIPRNLMGDPDWAIASIRIGAGYHTRVRRTYNDVQPGEMLALFSSADTLEVALNSCNASLMLRCNRGTKITVERGIIARGTTAA